MVSRQEQLHSRQLMTQRLVSALVRRDSEPDRPPARGAAGAALAGVLVTVLALAATAAWGAFTTPSPGDWRRPDVLVLAEGSGARYVWRDGALHPVGSYTSARLVLGAADPDTVTVPAPALAQVPRGAPLGIPGTPDALPPAGQLVLDDWLLCSTGSDGGGAPTSLLAVGAAGAVGAGATGAAVAPGHGLLVRVPDGPRYLVWQQRRHRIRDPEITLPAMGWTGRAPVPVAPAWLETLPAGPDLEAIAVPGLGRASAAVPGAVVGEVFVVPGHAGDPQYAVALAGGLVPVTATQVDLLLTDPRITSAVGRSTPRELARAEFAALPRLATGALDGAGLPAAAPPLTRPGPGGRTVCATVADGGGVAGVRVDVPLPPLARAVRTAGRTDGGDRLVRHILVAPGRGALVATRDGMAVVTDQGVRYRLAPEAAALLGYADVPPVEMPPELVSLLPAGPALDPAAAVEPTRPD